LAIEVEKRASAPQQGRVIRASEIGQFKYCARAWWLGHIVGVPSSNTREMAQGEAAHQRHGRAVWMSSALRIAALVLLVLAVIVVVLLVVL
jgi:hypothetical protein